MLLTALLLAPLAQADDAEVRRLSQNMEKLAQKNAWEGVERNYASIQALGGDVKPNVILLAAEAAKSRGDTSALIERLQAAVDAGAGPDAQAQLKTARNEFAQVELLCKGECPVLYPAVEPFRPDQRAAIALANTSVTESRSFSGYLPVGQYSFGHARMNVVPGNTPLRVEATTKAAKLRGLMQEVGLPREITVGKKGELMLNGAGVWTQDDALMYVGALYLRGPSSEAQHILSDTKHHQYILLHWLNPMSQAKVSADFERRFTKIDTAETTWGDQQLFFMLVDGVQPGDRLKFHWDPKKQETTVYKNDDEQGEIAGEAFFQVLWSSFLGEHTPSEQLRDGMLGITSLGPAPGTELPVE